jgi:hypothetical protein
MYFWSILIFSVLQATGLIDVTVSTVLHRSTAQSGVEMYSMHFLTQRYDDVVVDAGGRDSEELRTALVAVQKVYVPLLLRLRYP